MSENYLQGPSPYEGRPGMAKQPRTVIEQVGSEPSLVELKRRLEQVVEFKGLLERNPDMILRVLDLMRQTGL